MFRPCIFRALVFIVAFVLNAPPAWSQSIDLPALGDTSSEELSPATERKLGEQIMLEVRRDPSYLPDTETAEYLNHLGYQLVAFSPSRSLDFVFFAIRDPMLNAFALPGGFIGIHTGLILASQNESELAGVMSHEIGHVTQRHIARMLAKQRESATLALGALLLALLAARSGGSSSGDVAQAAIVGTQAAMIQQQLNFSREAERESDRVGFQTLTDAGFDSRGMESFFGRLQSGTRIYESAAPAYLRTHPMTIERISDMQNRTRNLRVKQRPDSLDFQLIRARVRVLQETSVQGWRNALEYFNGQLQNQTTSSEIAARYGIAVAALKLNQPELSVQAAQMARRLSPAPSPILDKIVVEARFAAARTDEERVAAVKLAGDVAARFPLSSLAVSNYLDVLNKANQHAAAIAFLRSQEAISRTQPAYYALLGRSYAALNRQSLQHQSTAEMYALLGAPGAAVNQLELARRANDGDFYTMSEIDARLRELQAEVKRDRENIREASRREPSAQR